MLARVQVSVRPFCTLPATAGGHPTQVRFFVRRSEASAAPSCEGLSARELEVVTEPLKGLTNTEITDESPGTLNK